MSQPTGISSFALAAASANNIALSQSPAGAGALTLNGSAAVAGIATLDRQRRVIITSAGNDSGRSFVITGTNQSGAIISETLTGANAGVAASLRDYLKVTSITVDAATAAAITVGTNGVGSSQWFKLDINRLIFAVSIADILLSGAINDTVEYTYDSVDDTTIVPAVFSLAAMTGYSATKDGTLGPGPVPSVRVTRNSGTGASRIVIVQQGI